MKIYTKTGDKGETGLFGGGRVRKDHPRIQAYGDVDELNSFIGWAKSLTQDKILSSELKRIQNNLFDIGAILASPHPEKLEGKSSSSVAPQEIEGLEKSIDRMEAELKPLLTFILPGGGEESSILHVARTVCRRAERQIITLSEREKISSQIIIYINRLSDYLFVLARWINFKKNVKEDTWEKQK